MMYGTTIEHAPDRSLGEAGPVWKRRIAPFGKVHKHLSACFLVRRAVAGPSGLAFLFL